MENPNYTHQGPTNCNSNINTVRLFSLGLETSGGLDKTGSCIGRTLLSLFSVLPGIVAFLARTVTGEVTWRRKDCAAFIQREHNPSPLTSHRLPKKERKVSSQNEENIHPPDEGHGGRSTTTSSSRHHHAFVVDTKIINTYHSDRVAFGRRWQ